MAKSLNGKIKQDWDEIEDSRIKTLEFLKENKCNRDTIDAVIMVIGELLENAIKYGSFSKKNDSITFSVDVSSRDITVEVQNPVNIEANYHLDRFDKMIQWIRGYQNPFEAYSERLKIVSGRPFEDKESGLGLARIAYEGQSILDFYVNEGNIISVSAIYKLE